MDDEKFPDNLDAGTFIYSRVLSRDIEHLRSYVTQFCTLCEETEKRVTQFIATHGLQMDTLSFLFKGTVMTNIYKILSGLNIFALLRVITARKRSLGQGNIFISVCHSVHEEVSV